MSSLRARSLRVVGIVLLGLLLLGAGVVARPLLGGSAAGQVTAGSDRAPREEERAVALVPGQPDTLRLSPEVVKRAGVRTAAAQRAQQPRALELHGSLGIDTNQLVRVHARFAGEVVEVSDIDVRPVSPGQIETVFRPVRFGDRVSKGQLLAVVWSKDLGEKKSELMDALSQLRTDQEQLAALEELARKGAIPETSLRQARRNVEADLNASVRAERTLRVWRVPDDEIQAVKNEAARVFQSRGRRDPDKEKNWARVEVRAPFEGIVVEKNLAVGDLIDTTADLFKIANLDSLTVWAQAYEEDLAALQALPEEDRLWTVRLSADPEAGAWRERIEKIGYVVDPSQHTAMVMGPLPNRDGKLRAGQFVTCQVNLPAVADEVALPASAVVEDGRDSIVFVQPRAEEPRYVQRRVAVARRGQGLVYVRSKVTALEAARGLEALRPGERVVIRGAIHLKEALEDLSANARARK
jgi:cobalt-zinc-cadmium efflux system membrane fusion protein